MARQSANQERKARFQRGIAIIQTEADDRLATENVIAQLDGHEDLIREIDEQGFTLLHHAARRRNGALVLSLLELGADPNAMTFDLESPLSLTDANKSPLQLRENIAAEFDTWRTELEPVMDFWQKES